MYLVYSLISVFFLSFLNVCVSAFGTVKVISGWV